MSRIDLSFKRRQNRRRYKLKMRNDGTRIRLSLFKSNKFIYAQAINDDDHMTVASFGSNSKDFPKDLKSYGKDASKLVGKVIAEKLVERGIKKIVCDIGGWKMHGCIKALADSARDNGLDF